MIEGALARRLPQGSHTTRICTCTTLHVIKNPRSRNSGTSLCPEESCPLEGWARVEPRRFLFICERIAMLLLMLLLLLLLLLLRTNY